MKRVFFDNIRLVVCYGYPSQIELFDLLKRKNILAVWVNADVLDNMLDFSYTPFIDCIELDKFDMNNLFTKYNISNLDAILICSTVSGFPRDNYTEYNIITEQELSFSLLMDSFSNQILDYNVHQHPLEYQFQQLLSSNNSIKVKIFLFKHSDDPQIILAYVQNSIKTNDTRKLKKAFKLAKKHYTDNKNEYAIILSNFYYDGKIVNKDLQKSIEYLSKADLANRPEYYPIFVNRLREEGSP